jgi:putative transposase
MVARHIPVQASDANAAKRFFKRVLRACNMLRERIVTDNLRSSGAARRQLLSAVEHRQSRYLKTSGRELDATMRAADATVQIAEQAQVFLTAHSFIYGDFHPRRHQLVLMLIA